MHNTIGDVTLTSIRRETIYHHDHDDIVQYPKSKFFAFPRPHFVSKFVLLVFLNFGHF